MIVKNILQLVENSISEDSEITIWEFLKLTEQFVWKSHEGKSCFKVHKKWKHIEWSQGLKKKTKDIYNNPHYLTKDQLDLIDFHKYLAIEINKIEIEIALFYSSGGHKYQKLSEFNEWYIKEYNINFKTIAEDKNIKNYGIESLMNLY